MGWAIGYGNGRDIGYGVPAICDQPDCNEEIDRGISYACGGFRSDNGCGLYFCEKHLTWFTAEDESEEFAEDDGIEFCDHCLWGLEHPDAEYNDPKRPPYHDPKPDILKWIVWKLAAPSWETWRKEDIHEVPEFAKQIDKYTIAEVEKELSGLKEDLENDV